MPTDKQQRNAAIAAELSSGAKPEALTAKYGLSRASVYRIARQAFAADSNPDQIGPAGRSAAAVNLYSERGTSGLRRFGGSIDDDYDRVFRTLRSRMALYREMGDDPIVAAVLQAIKMTLRRVKWTAQPTGDTDADKRAAEWLGTCMDDMSQSWTDTIDQAVGCIQYGFYPGELVYKPRRGDREQTLTTAGPDGQPVTIELPPSKYDDGKIGWRKWVFMAPETLAPGSEWVFDEHGGLEGLNQQAPPHYQTVFIPIEKVINFRTTAERGNPEGRSILRAMYKPWYFKNNLEEVEAISAERFGTGLPVAYLGSNTSKNIDDPNNDLATFMDIVRNVRIDEQSGIVIPYAKMGSGAKEGEGVLFEFATPPGTGPVNFGETINRHEQRMAMVGLAQFIHLGMSGVGARALGESSQDFFTLAVSAWADALADTIQRYAVDRLFKLNSFPGLTAVPHIAHEAVAQTDIKMVADYINALAGKELLTPSEELERHLLELADLPVSPKLTEIWAAKDKARENGLQMAAQGGAPADTTAAPEVAQGNQAGTPVGGKDKANDPTGAELAAELRRANELLAAALEVERMQVAA